MGLVSLSLFQDEHSWVDERVDIHTSSTSRSLDSESIGIASARTTSFSENIGSKSLRFIDLFAGIGGFHLALHHQGAKCVDIQSHKRYKKYLLYKRLPIGPLSAVLDFVYTILLRKKKI